jgi:hypothetical protein
MLVLLMFCMLVAPLPVLLLAFMLKSVALHVGLVLLVQRSAVCLVFPCIPVVIVPKGAPILVPPTFAGQGGGVDFSYIAVVELDPSRRGGVSIAIPTR